MAGVKLDTASRELTHYLYNQGRLKENDYIVMNEKNSGIWLVTMITDDQEQDDFAGKYELYKGRLIFKFYPTQLDINSLVADNYLNKKCNIRNIYKEPIKLLSSYVDKHCKVVGQLNLRVNNYFLYYYKGKIETGIEIANQIGNDRLVVRVFKDNIKHAKKEVRDFFSERYFKEVSNKSLHNMTKKERELVEIINT